MAEPGLDPKKIGRAVVKCDGCGFHRWYGYGPCGHCGDYLPGALTGDETIGLYDPLGPRCPQ